MFIMTFCVQMITMLGRNDCVVRVITHLFT